MAPVEIKKNQGEWDYHSLHDLVGVVTFPTLCSVGVSGDELVTIPGTPYGYGGGAVCWGLIPLAEVREGMDVEGLAIAVPIHGPLTRSQAERLESLFR